MSARELAGDAAWMRKALELAGRGEGATHPNPPVGAILVRADRIIGAGFHRYAGGAHAEVEALRGLARRETEGATLYVTLEPCSSHGRTPPCTEAILAAGVRRVVVCMQDPNPRHRGRGVRLLRRRGVEVRSGVCRAEGKVLLAPFTKWITTGRPYVTLKMAMTLDGRIADGAGNSKWITGSAARREVQQLRTRVDTVLVGAGTVAADDPSLLVRGRTRRQPLRLVLDGAARLPLDARVLSDGFPTVVATTEQAPQARRAALAAAGADVWVCGDGSRVDLEALMLRLGEAGHLHVLCEGGGILAGALLRAGLVDVCRFYVAGSLLGGTGVPVTGRDGWYLAEAPRLDICAVGQVGADVRIDARPCDIKGEEACLRG